MTAAGTMDDQARVQPKEEKIVQSMASVMDSSAAALRFGDRHPNRSWRRGLEAAPLQATCSVPGARPQCFGSALSGTYCDRPCSDE
jgi:hypothetical protein